MFSSHPEHMVMCFSTESKLFKMQNCWCFGEMEKTCVSIFGGIIFSSSFSAKNHQRELNPLSFASACLQKTIQNTKTAPCENVDIFSRSCKPSPKFATLYSSCSAESFAHVLSPSQPWKKTPHVNVSQGGVLAGNRTIFLPFSYLGDWNIWWEQKPSSWILVGSLTKILLVAKNLYKWVVFRRRYCLKRPRLFFHCSNLNTPMWVYWTPLMNKLPVWRSHSST